MKILVCMLCCGRSTEYGKYSIEINRKYCLRHGYDFYVEYNQLDSEKHPYWSKVLLLQNCLSRADYIFFIDADACFANFDKKIEDYISDKPIVIGNENRNQEPPHGENSGVILLKNDNVSKQFLIDTWNLFEEYRSNPCPEQAAMGSLIDGRYKEYVKKLPCKDFNSYYGGFANGLGKPWCLYSTGDFIIHLLRESTENRINKFKEIMRSIPVETIRDFKHKKLVEYLRPGIGCLIHFCHGLGDLIMFLPIYNYLKKTYKDVRWGIEVYNGQEDVWNEKIDNPDYKFDIGFPCSEWRSENITKMALCCREEIGIDANKVDRVFDIPETDSPFIGVAFQSTCMTGDNIRDDKAKAIWQGIIDAGKVPIEVHFNHNHADGKNVKYDFVNCSTRDAKANICNLVGVIRQCSGFIGLATGSTWVAMALNIPTLFVNAGAMKAEKLLITKVDTIDKDKLSKEFVRTWVRKVTVD